MDQNTESQTSNVSLQKHYETKVAKVAKVQIKIYIYICMCKYMYIFVYAQSYIYIFKYMQVNINMCIYKEINITRKNQTQKKCIHMYLCMYIYHVWILAWRLQIRVVFCRNQIGICNKRYNERSILH